jgi:hypothetical protein
MGILVSEDQINLYKFYVGAIISDLGRNVTLFIPGPKKRCFNCLFDPINKRSTGMYSPQLPLPTGQVHVPFTGGICPICNGTGQFTTQTVKIVKCGIRPLKDKEKTFMNQGFNENFDFRLKAPISALADFQAARIIVVDGIPTQVQSIVKKGLRDIIQFVAFVKVSEWPKGFQSDISKV